MRNVLFIILVGFLQAQTESINPEDYRNREVTAIRLEQPLEIDGILDESLYSTISNGPLIQIEPNNGVLASEDTKFWVGYDDNALYFGVLMYDSNPDSIVARMSRRDHGGEETSDMLYIAIDSYHDKRSGFMFGINPIGSISDFTLSNDSNIDDSWDGIWDGRSRINKNGWSAEIKVPFSQLRFNKADENIMGIGLARKIHRKNETDFFTFMARDESGLVSHFGTVRGIKNIQPPKRLELIPYITGYHSILKTEEDNPFYNGKYSQVNIGTDLKIGIGNNLTIDATINPDFGQVEVDPSQLNLSAFETRYREKRPFFVEGKSIFGFGTGGPTNHMNIGTMEPTFFYSRRIGRYPQGDVDGDWVKIPSATSIIGATKISGKITDSWAVGGVSAITRREFASVNIDDDNSEIEVEPFTSYNLFRTLKEFNKGRQGLGLVTTYVDRKFDDKSLRNLLSDNSTVIGIDGWTFLNKEKDWVIGGFLGYSNVRGSKDYISDLQQSSARYYQRPDADHVELDPNRTNLDGFVGKATINKETGNWSFNSAIQLVSPGFENNDMGLNFRADNINKHISFGYKWLEPGEIFQFAMLNTAYMTNHNFAGEKLNELVFLFGFGRFKNYWTINPEIGISPRTLSGQKLRGGPMVISPAGSWVGIFARTDSRKPIIFELGGGYERSEKGSYSLRFSPEVEMNLGTRLRLEFEPGFKKQVQLDQYIDSFDDETAIEMLGGRHIVAQMERNTVSAELRVDYTFTPKLSLQAYFQPYMTVGSYSRFKEFKQPESYDFVEYGKDNGMEIAKDDDDGYELYPNGRNGNSIYVENPDFNYKALVGSAVLRWEFRPGSTLYIVWTHNGSDEQNPGNFNFNRDVKDLFQADADNIFALKLTYWLGK